MKIFCITLIIALSACSRPSEADNHQKVELEQYYKFTKCWQRVHAKKDEFEAIAIVSKFDGSHVVIDPISNLCRVSIKEIDPSAFGQSVGFGGFDNLTKSQLDIIGGKIKSNKTMDLFRSADRVIFLRGRARVMYGSGGYRLTIIPLEITEAKRLNVNYMDVYKRVVAD